MTDERQPESPEPADDGGELSRGGKIAAMVAGAVVLLGGGIAAGYVLFNDDDEDAAVTGETAGVTVSPEEVGTADQDSHSSPEATGESQPDEGNETDDDGSGDGSADIADGPAVAQAVNAALESQPGIATTADLDDDGRRWEIDVLADDDSWHEVLVDGSSFDVVSVQPDDDDDQDDVSDARQAQVLLVDAAATAATEVGGDVTSIDLDDEFDDSPRLTWDAEVATNGATRNVEVAADTGEVLANTADDD